MQLGDLMIGVFFVGWIDIVSWVIHFLCCAFGSKSSNFFSLRFRGGASEQGMLCCFFFSFVAVLAYWVDVGI